MRAIAKRPGMAVTLALLAAAGIAACSVNQPPRDAEPGNSQTAGIPATPAATQAPSPPAGAPSTSATPAVASSVKNLVISSAERIDLRTAFLGYKGVTTWAQYVGGPTLGTVYYAYDPATDTYWAMGTFWGYAQAQVYLPNFWADYLRGGGFAMFKKVGAAGSWQVQSTYCPRSTAIWQFFPPSVLGAWSISTTVPLGPSGLYLVAC